mmetsp:Transcript_62200/g.182372  ORF Transcript_62200/g.182372 Transcript_62200/m.182372 type:complete len:372 (+) Transcript_62200:633-1748(+)
MLGADVARHRERVRLVGKQDDLHLLKVDAEEKYGHDDALVGPGSVPPPQKGEFVDRPLVGTRRQAAVLRELGFPLVRELVSVAGVLLVLPAPLVELQGLLGDPQVEGDAADGEVHPVELDDKCHGQAVEDGVPDNSAGEDEAHGVDADQVADHQAHQERQGRPREQEHRPEEDAHPGEPRGDVCGEPLARPRVPGLYPADGVEHEGHVPHRLGQVAELRELEDGDHEELQVPHQVVERLRLVLGPFADAPGDVEVEAECENGGHLDEEDGDAHQPHEEGVDHHVHAPPDHAALLHLDVQAPEGCNQDGGVDARLREAVHLDLLVWNHVIARDMIALLRVHVQERCLFAGHLQNRRLGRATSRMCAPLTAGR